MRLKVCFTMLIFNFPSVSVSVCLCVWACVWVLEEAKHLDALELELQAIMSCLMQVMGTELGSLAKAVQAFN